MRRFSAIIFLLCTFSLAMSAQHIQRNYHDRSMSDVLIDLDKASKRYKISFIYNELEDFTVTQNVKTTNIPDAIRKVIGFYPMQMTVGDSLITVECIRKSERKLIGRLIDNHNLPVEFANIQLLNPKDSSFLCGGVSNANGDFVIPCQQEQALMKVSFVGYKTICKLVPIVRIGNVKMQAKSFLLKGVTVEAARVVEKVDRQIIFPTKEQVKTASNGYDLLDNLSLPTIVVNRAERKVLSLKGGEVQMRINDVKASMQDVLALQPDEVTKVEFINVPGLKYGDSNLDAVINYQVRRRYAGYVGGVSTMQGTKAGFNNSDGYFKYNVKKSEFSINYSFSYRSVEERSYESLGTYHLPTGETLHRNYLGYDSPFLYTTNNVQLGYNLSEPDKYTLNVRLNFYNYNSPVRGMNQLYQESGKADQYLLNNRKMLEQIPSLDIYYSLNMPHDQNLALNLVGTYIGTDYQYRMREYTFNKSPDESVKNAPLTDYSYDATGRKRSLIGEGTYSKNWKQMALSVGGQYNISHTDNIYVGSSNADTELKYSNLYLFTQLQGQQKWFSYQVGVGATRSSIHQGENGYSKWLFRPQVTLQAKASDRLSFKWSSKITSDIPSLSDLSELRQYSNSFEARDGNSGLKPFTGYNNTLSASWNIPLMSVYLEGNWTYYDKPIATSILPEKREDGSYLFVSKPKNQKSHNYKHLLLTPEVHLIKDHLDLNLMCEYQNVKTKGLDYSHEFNYFSYGAEIRYMTGNWNIGYGAYKVEKSFWGEKTNGGEPTSNLAVTYSYKNWQFGVLGLFVFYPHGCVYKDELFNKYVQQKNKVRLADQGNMLVFTASFNFSHGRRYHTGSRKLNNSDRDNGIR
ncbi:TonB-dependent receptor [Segatella hominis]|uniref:TonB-dependent receptor n=1 Tax=Segatella hominis TaxID=2518605 RepID=UPI001C481F75|nr:TonB-dependent receptor [Segatella hominis]WOZ80447.1 TonB-dependent receptor [Segatella hominis]